MRTWGGVCCSCASTCSARSCRLLAHASPRAAASASQPLAHAPAACRCTGMESLRTHRSTRCSCVPQFSGTRTALFLFGVSAPLWPAVSLFLFAGARLPISGPFIEKNTQNVGVCHGDKVAEWAPRSLRILNRGAAPFPKSQTPVCRLCGKMPHEKPPMNTTLHTVEQKQNKTRVGACTGRDGPPGSGSVQRGNGSAGAPPRGVAIGARIEHAEVGPL